MKKLLLISSLLVMAPVAFAQSAAIFMPEGPLTIETQSGPVTITAEVADEPDEIATGLMFRENIAEDRGMIFDFGTPREPNMWMRNVEFPIDMVFMDAEGTVLAIVAHAQAHSERHINPGFPVKGVLELADGQANAFGIRPGDQIIHEIFGNAETGPAEDTSDSEEAAE
ncbi:DUF192 domain-containing protein [Ponticaulis sp.]|uniref:DUF192 domain-containing protein n=1 Tax=Ponticaulis sp. TaxID=2020902 RepID=UPI000C44E147|nr:DUF192 domain-containing protein [Ponticaulis sp.]MAF59054.1 hypothetical protein [Ponticaulis sp.]MBN04767.1 hypothetical protein [Ponticaulis sp.]